MRFAKRILTKAFGKIIQPKENFATDSNYFSGPVFEPGML